MKSRYYLIIAATLFLIGQLTAQDFSFTSKTEYPVDPKPHCVRPADLNNDGNIDLISANRDSANVTVFIGNGDGTFQSGIDYPAGPRARDLAIADYDGDNFLDLAVANEASDSISVLINNGDGTFPVTVNYLASHADNYGGRCRPWHIESTDFNLDTSPDLAVTVTNRSEDDAAPNDKTYLFLNNGDGTFAFIDSLEVSDDPRGICAGDFDDDGHDDFAAGCHSGYIDVFFNNGDSTFTRQITDVSNSPVDICSADFDGNSSQDIAMLTEPNWRAAILINDGSGTFTTGSTASVGEPWSINSADMDGDGDQDLLVAATNGYIVSNNGNGILGSPTKILSGGFPRSICAADFDGDGDNDPAIANAASFYIITWKNVTTCPGETITTPGQLMGPTTGMEYISLSYSTNGSISSCGDDLQYLCDWDDGSPQVWSDSAGANHIWTLEGAYNIRVKARCQIHTATESDWSPILEVTINPDSFSVTTPLTPTGPANGLTDRSYIYSTASSVSTHDGDIEYRFDWGANRLSSWSALTSVSNVWDTAGTYNIRAQARCKTHTYVVSEWSDSMQVTINPDTCGVEIVSIPNAPVGPTTSDEDITLTYSCTGAVSSCGHELQYRFNWGDGSFSTWTTIDSASHSWITENTYHVIVKARCKIHPSVEANWSPATTVTITASDKDSSAIAFGDPLYYPVGDNPYCVRSADFDNDGLLDLVSANSSSGTVSILLGNGNGTFQEASSYTSGSSPRDIAIADYNGDQYLDLAVANWSEGSISILINNGNATFAEPVKYPAIQIDGYITNLPVKLAAGDFDGDGFPDLVVPLTDDYVEMSYSHDRILLFTNNGDGTFADARIFNFSSLSRQDANSICTGDFNRDGNLDFATLFSMGGVYVYYNRGDASFTRNSFSPGTYFCDLHTSDLDGDGDLDFIMYGTDYDNRDLVTMQNDGSGNFSVRTRIDCGFGNATFAGDIDADDDNDIILAATDVLVLPNAGSANPRSPVSVFSGGSPRSVCAADFDADGDNDLAIANTAVDAVVVLPNTIGETPREEFFNPYQWLGRGAEIYDIITADFDGDSLDDLAYTSYDIISGVPGARFDERITVMTRGGTGLIHNTAAIEWDDHRDWYNADDNPFFNVCAGDFDGDGATDIAGSEMLRTMRALNQGTGSFDGEGTVNYLKGEVCSADLNKDGNDDLLIATSTLYVKLSNGDGSFADSVAYGFSGTALDIKSGDFNNDGNVDIVVVSGSLSILFGNGDGTLNPAVNYDGGGKGVCIGDLNNDGWLDLATCGSSTLMAVRLNDGAGNFSTRTLYSPGATGIDISTIDVNGDGALDLAVINYSVYEVLLYINDGSGDFTFQNKYPVGRAPRALVTLDYDDDGDNDLAVACHGGFSFYNERGGLSILKNRLYDVTAADDEDDLPALPTEYRLSQNYPNPFNPTTTIEYSLSRSTFVAIDIFNIIGQRVTTLENSYKEAGEHSVIWNGRDESGKPVSTGIYLYRMTAGNHTETKKMTLVK